MAADDQVAIAVAVRCGAEVGRVGGHHPVIEGLGMDQIGVGMVMAEVGQGGAVHHRAGRCAQALFENFGRIGAGYRAHRIEGEGEAAGDHRPDRGEIEQAFHQRGIAGDRIDHFDGHGAQLAGPQRVDIDVSGVEDAIAVDRQGPRVDRVGHLLWGWPAVRHIIFDAEILVRPAGIMAGRQHQSAKGAGRSDQM